MDRVLTTDDEIYGGSGIHNGTVEAIEGEYHHVIGPRKSPFRHWAQYS